MPLEPPLWEGVRLALIHKPENSLIGLGSHSTKDREVSFFMVIFALHGG